MKGKGRRAKGRTFGALPIDQMSLGRFREAVSTPKLFVYERSLELVSASEIVARALPSFRADLADQLRRAAASVALNTAEGASELSPREKIRFYRMAHRSAAECEAIVDVIDRVIDAPLPTARVRKMVEEVQALLTRTSKAVEARN